MEHSFCPYCMARVEEGKPCAACGLTQGSYTPSPHHLPPGTVLKERYMIGRVLGEGGFGITYIGCDLQLELKVAIKEYFPTDKASRVAQATLEVSSYTGAAGVNYDKGMEKFLREARTIARMDKQPVIVNVRDFFQVNHTAYIVMEYVEGTTFKELVEQRGGRIPAGELLYLMEPLFFALKEMHGNGLIHRDISPENLMIEKGEVRLLDFGCARESADGGNTLTIALKHGYAPVEQYQSKGQGPWTDVYALSATIYYCLTGKKPPQAMDRLLEDEIVPPRKLGVDLTQRQEEALLRGMAVAPKRRYQSMDEFHTALYEGFIPAAAEETGGRAEPAAAPAAPAAAAEEAPSVPDTAEKTAETPPDAGKARFDLTAWLKENKLLACGAAAALALVILIAAVLPRAMGPSRPDDPAPVQTAGPSGTTKPGATPSLPVSADPGVDYLALFMETAEWLRRDDVELDGTALRARLDALPVDGLFANAVHVDTLEGLYEALGEGRPIVIDADIDCSRSTFSNPSNSEPVLISEGVTVTTAWSDTDDYENVESSSAVWAVHSSILINRGTLRGRVIMGDWENDGVMGTNLLVNYGTMYGDLGAGYDNDSYNVVVNLGAMGISRTQFRQTSFYNLGTLSHGVIAPEGETPVRVRAELNSDYFIDLIGCYFYNGGELVMEGENNDKWSRIDVAYCGDFVNAGSIRLGSYGEVRNHATLFNHGEIIASDRTGAVNNEGWLLNTEADSVLDATCYNVGLVQYLPGAAGVNLSKIRDDGGAVLPFGWAGLDRDERFRYICSEEEFYAALEDRGCAWIIAVDGVSLTLTEDLILTKGLAIPDGAGILTMDGCSLTVAGEKGYLVADGPVDLRGGALTVRDEAVASVAELRDCGGITIKNKGYLLHRGELRPNDGAAIQLSNARYLCSIGPLELRGARVSIDVGMLRGTGGVGLYGCTVDIGESGEFLNSQCGAYFDPDTVITNYGKLSTFAWDTVEYACRLTSYGRLEGDQEIVISGSVVNHGYFWVWCGGDALIRVSGSLENRGTVELEGGGGFQPWAAGTVTGVPDKYVAK